MISKMSTILKLWKASDLPCGCVASRNARDFIRTAPHELHVGRASFHKQKGVC